MSAAPQCEPGAAFNRESGRRERVVGITFVVLLIAGAFLLRLWPLSKVHFWDEAVYLQNAEAICCGKVNYSELDSRPPLLSVIFAAMFLLKNHVYAASIVTALLNALGPGLLYVGGRMIVGRFAAGIASALLAFLPFFVGVFPSGFISDDTGNSLLSDSPALTLLVLAFWVLLCALRRQSQLRFAIAGFVLALAVLMRFASLSTAGVLGLLAFAADRWARAALAIAAGFAAGLVPYLCWSRLRYGGFFRTFTNGWEHFRGPGESPFFYLKNFPAIFSWITVAGLTLWLGRWLWGKWQHKAAGPPVRPAPSLRLNRLEPFLWVWASALLLFFSVLRHKEPRYVMPVAPPVLLLAGSGLSIRLQGRRRSIRVAGTCLLLGALAYTFFPVCARFESPFIDDEVSEEMQVADFLNHNVAPSTVLYSNFNYPVFAYYTNLRVHRLLESGPALYAALDHLPGNGILIAYKESEAAEPRLEWLDANPHFRRFREFSSLVLYEYHTGTAGEGTRSP